MLSYGQAAEVETSGVASRYWHVANYVLSPSQVTSRSAKITPFFQAESGAAIDLCVEDFLVG